mmetsp:Transcript_66095/g.59349  ORF Transcript_66095/g.59349 Transcript_66095/m.59349 type:complete len:231 (+) Transcript_66095:23-715(+)
MMSASSDDNDMSSEQDGLVEHRDASPILLNDPRKEPVAKFLGMCYICCFVLALTPCIVALLFATEYVNNTSSAICQQPLSSVDGYLIPLDIWLYTAATLTIIISLIYIFINGYQTFAASLITYTKISEYLLSTSHGLFQFVITSFHTAWGIIGIYMYSNQMSSECQSTDIATMILLFSILELMNTCCVSCCVCCMVANRDRASFQTNTTFMFNSTLSSPITNNTTQAQKV